MTLFSGFSLSSSDRRQIPRRCKQRCRLDQVYHRISKGKCKCEIGEHHIHETHLIPLVLDTALGRRKAIDIYGQDYPTPDGTAIRDYIHIVDLAAAHMKAMNYLMDGGSTLAANLGTGQGASVEEVIATAERVTGRSIARRAAPRRAGDPAELIAKSGLARETLGWQTERSDLETVIADAWHWHQQRFNGEVVAERVRK